MAPKSKSTPDKALKDLKNRTICVLAVAYMASMGIVVYKERNVINNEIPQQAETCVHLIADGHYR